VALSELEEHDRFNTDGDAADMPSQDGRLGHLQEMAEGAPPQGSDTDEERRQ
jgi:hypothetical protein